MQAHMKRRLCSVIIGTMLLSGCSLFGTSQSDDDDCFLTGGSYADNQVVSSKNEYQWLLKPSIQAANIISSDLGYVNTDDEVNRSFVQTSIIYNNGKYGFINYDGSIILEPSYDYYYICNCGQMILYNMSDEEISEICTLDKQGQIVYDTYIHEDDAPEYFWDETTQKTYVKKKNEDYAREYTENGIVVAAKTTVTMIEYNSYSIPALTNPVYGVVKDNKMLTDFEYEDYYAPPFRSVKSTAIALKKNGKWGYISEDGSEIIPFECDDILSSYNGSINNISDKSHPYLFSDGFVPVCIDSSYCYYNMSGECVVSHGEFEQARPVVNGKAWVKCNGKWGVIQLGEVKEITLYTTTTLSTTTKSLESSSTSKTSTTSTKTTSKTTSKSASATTSKTTTPTNTSQNSNTTAVSEQTTIKTETTTAPVQTTVASDTTI